MATTCRTYCCTSVCERRQENWSLSDSLATFAIKDPSATIYTQEHMQTRQMIRSYCATKIRLRVRWGSKTHVRAYHQFTMSRVPRQLTAANRRSSARRGGYAGGTICGFSTKETIAPNFISTLFLLRWGPDPARTPNNWKLMTPCRGM